MYSHRVHAVDVGERQSDGVMEATYLHGVADGAQLGAGVELAVPPLARLVRVALAALGALGSL